MKRKHKTYSRPKRPFEKQRIEEENKVKEEFGLKNKREIWKAEARIKEMREKAKNIISASPEKQKALFDQLKKIGLNVNSVSDILSLTREDYLKRRLQTVLVKKRLAKTAKEARQLIVHKKVIVNGHAVSIPSFVVPVSLEEKIELKPKKAKVKKVKEEKTVGEENA
ncbi:30S ribosomal protein S4 [uncultured archaeon]|nr:30S ribosomal protein S4 [uncultured archaeon]